MIEVSHDTIVLVAVLATAFVCLIAWCGYEMGRQVEMERNNRMSGIRANPNNGPNGSRYYR